MNEDILKALYETLLTRRGADPGTSYVASLYKKGTAAICDKVMEEAAEVVEEARSGDAPRLAEESADLIFHLMVLWADQGVHPEDVISILRRRQGISGHDEKAARPKS